MQSRSSDYTERLSEISGNQAFKASCESSGLAEELKKFIKINFLSFIIFIQVPTIINTIVKQLYIKEPIKNDKRNCIFTIAKGVDRCVSTIKRGYERLTKRPGSGGGIKCEPSI